MYIIVGLGNPEEEYAGTRHNMGFDVINKIADTYSIQVNKNKFNSLYAKSNIEGQEVMLVKPQTYMNLSGTSVREIKNFYKIPKEDILIIYDDMDIEQGTIKIRKKGSAGGHNGVKSVIGNLGTEEIQRIRVGIGKTTANEDKIKYVLGHISKEDRKILEEGIEKAKEAVIEILKNGIDKAMNKYN
ncbi:MAG: aminoacyl-tRNA hydrolase [Clostridia bacterium]|nr:aminoacyl-tRNA hydrolase [Clostridia bacterium]